MLLWVWLFFTVALRMMKNLWCLMGKIFWNMFHILILMGSCTTSLTYKPFKGLEQLDESQIQNIRFPFQENKPCFIKNHCIFSKWIYSSDRTWPGNWRGKIQVEKDMSNGILLPKLFWPIVRINCSSDWKKLLKFEAEGTEFVKILRSLEQFIQTVLGQNNCWWQNSHPPNEFLFNKW